MNPFITDYGSEQYKPSACDVRDKFVKKEIKDNFNFNLYKNVEDLWEKKNSQRQFYTLPNTILPNNQKEFANWLYNVPHTCKVDQEKCLRYEDLRFKR
jgi:hypothetical protein